MSKSILALMAALTLSTVVQADEVCKGECMVSTTRIENHWDVFNQWAYTYTNNCIENGGEVKHVTSSNFDACYMTRAWVVPITSSRGEDDIRGQCEAFNTEPNELDEFRTAELEDIDCD